MLWLSSDRLSRERERERERNDKVVWQTGFVYINSAMYNDEVTRYIHF